MFMSNGSLLGEGRWQQVNEILTMSFKSRKMQMSLAFTSFYIFFFKPRSLTIYIIITNGTKKKYNSNHNWNQIRCVVNLSFIPAIWWLFVGSADLFVQFLLFFMYLSDYLNLGVFSTFATSKYKMSANREWKFRRISRAEREKTTSSINSPASQVIQINKIKHYYRIECHNIYIWASSRTCNSSERFCWLYTWRRECLDFLVLQFSPWRPFIFFFSPSAQSAAASIIRKMPSSSKVRPFFKLNFFLHKYWKE